LRWQPTLFLLSRFDREFLLFFLILIFLLEQASLCYHPFILYHPRNLLIEEEVLKTRKCSLARHCTARIGIMCLVSRMQRLEEAASTILVSFGLVSFWDSTIAPRRAALSLSAQASRDSLQRALEALGGVLSVRS
jgi:hypothetical protein